MITFVGRFGSPSKTQFSRDSPEDVSEWPEAKFERYLTRFGNFRKARSQV